MSDVRMRLHGFGGTRQYLFDGLLKILGDDGLAIRDGLAASNAQRDYAQRWCEVIARSDERNLKTDEAPAGIMLASADTGTGKTIGYGIPLLLRAAMGKKVAIATFSHALQKQFLGTPEKPGDIVKIAGWISELGLGDLSIARRLGRQAFISLSALELVIGQMKANRQALQLTMQDFADLQPLIDFAVAANAGKSSGLLEDIREHFGGELPLQITVSSIGLGGDSDVADSFAYEQHLVRAEEADVVIVSHAHLAACAMYRGGEILQTPIDTLVIDEADRLVDVAASTFRFEMSLRRSSSNMEGVPGALSEKAKVSLNELANYAQSLFEKNKAIIVTDLLSHQQEMLVELGGRAMKAFSAVVASLEGRLGKISRDTLDELQHQEAVIKRFFESVGPGRKAQSNQGEKVSEMFVAAISFSPVHSLPSLMVMPINPGRLMARIWNLKKSVKPDERRSVVNSVLLTSATLGAPGYYPDAVTRFKVLAGDLGISLTPKPYQACEYDLWSYFEPENFGVVRFILADPSVPSPVYGVDDNSRAVLDPDWFAYSVRMVKAAHMAGGRTLVLVNSYKDAELFASMLIQEIPTLIQQMKGQSTKDCEKTFLADKRAVWISPTAWEGLNLPGAIANLVIPRLPFPPPDLSESALLKAYSELTNIAIEKIQSAKRMNAVKRKTRQGMFRPIRSKNDKARIWVADPRFPLHAESQIPLKYPALIKYASGRRYPALHFVVPNRFLPALEHAEVLTIAGQLLK